MFLRRLDVVDQHQHNVVATFPGDDEQKPVSSGPLDASAVKTRPLQL
jgi:hypothetical protein